MSSPPGGLLICDPEGPQRGGLSIALDQLLEVVHQAGIPYWRLQCREAELPALLTRLQPAAVLAVGWHTWSEAVVQQARRQAIPVAFWSHGVGCCHLYTARPILGVLRWLARSWQVFQVAGTLRRLQHLVVAYPRVHSLDPRSVDAALARWIGIPISVIPNPVDTQFWHPLGPTEGQRSSVLSIGRLEWQKGHGQAWRIVTRADLAAPKLVCLAPAATPLGAQMLEQARRQGLSHQLDLALALAPEARRRHVQNALAVVSWSETEYQSLAMLEAMACACPVIARPRGWLRGRQLPGVLVTESPSQAAAWLTQLQRDPAWAAQLGQAGRAYVERHHARPVVADHWLSLLHKLMQGPDAGAGLG